MKRLISAINTRQIFASYPIQFMQDNSTNDFVDDLEEVVMKLQSMDFYSQPDTIHNEDLFDITMFLTEKLYDLKKLKQNK